MMIVDDKGFIVLIRYIICGIQVSLPERAKMREENIALAVEYRRRVRSVVETGCWYFWITSDIWTAGNAKSYISLTIHYVDNEFCPQSWTLEVRELPGIHDGAVVALAIEQILENWSLLQHNCVRFLRDGGSNMVAAGELLGIDHMSCIAHSLAQHGS
ncbi:hypothetical protein JG688_00018196 [Phytophthora aleatoria]|uniref:Uncharacterized protein n=1 Tax=Phytophthora aleatoria TaxID=2496075 RepID=A0A8J5IPT7_9STRA|nr:hypothetical protein JG688_00018196 [Phytophthora aleatoria]